MVFSNTDGITKYPPDLFRVYVWRSALLEFVYNTLTQISALAIELKSVSDRVEVTRQQTDLIGDNRLTREPVVKVSYRARPMNDGRSLVSAESEKQSPFSIPSCCTNWMREQTYFDRVGTGSNIFVKGPSLLRA